MNLRYLLLFGILLTQKSFAMEVEDSHTYRSWWEQIILEYPVDNKNCTSETTYTTVTEYDNTPASSVDAGFLLDYDNTPAPIDDAGFLLDDNTSALTGDAKFLKCDEKDEVLDLDGSKQIINLENTPVSSSNPLPLAILKQKKQQLKRHTKSSTVAISKKKSSDTYSPDKKYACIICKKLFTTFYYLPEHERHCRQWYPKKWAIADRKGLKNKRPHTWGKDQ